RRPFLRPRAYLQHPRDQRSPYSPPRPGRFSGADPEPPYTFPLGPEVPSPVLRSRSTSFPASRACGHAVPTPSLHPTTPLPDRPPTRRLERFPVGYTRVYLSALSAHRDFRKSSRSRIQPTPS